MPVFEPGARFGPFRALFFDDDFFDDDFFDDDFFDEDFFDDDFFADDLFFVVAAATISSPTASAS